MNILHVDGSILGGRSVSRELSRLVIERIGADEHSVVYRDVADDLPHLNMANVPSAHPLSQMVTTLDATQQAQRAQSDAVLAEFLAADVIVLGVPMYNFVLSSGIKAWIDRIVVPGVTFRKTQDGTEGLAGGKRVILALARGGSYTVGSPAAAAEHAESALRTLFGFLGITDIESVVAEGLSLGAEQREAAIAHARDAIGQLAA